MKIKLFKQFLNEGYATAEGQFMDRVFGELGYDDFHEFIADNPGAKEVLLEWIVTIPEFKKKLEHSDLEGLDGYVETETEEED